MTPDDIYNILNYYSIPFKRFDHPAAVTTEEADKVIPFFDAVRTKNLFLRTSSGKYHFLATIKSDRRIDLKELSDIINKGKIGFASTERLDKYLGVAPGAISLLSILCDKENNVDLLVDEDVWNAKMILCHPLINTVTLIIPMPQMRNLLIKEGHSPVLLSTGNCIK